MKSVYTIRFLVLSCLAGCLVCACENELNPQSPDSKTIPIVYSVLELHRDTLSVRLTQTYAGTESALSSARSEDSLYFPVARVWLEKWNGNFRVNRAELTRTNQNPRVPGIFSEKPNWNYILVRSPETETIFTGSVSDQEYHLSIEVPGFPLIFAKTNAYSPARLTLPRISGTLNLFLNPLDFAWKTDAPYSELYFKLYYINVNFDGSEVPGCATWREYHKFKSDDPDKDPIYGQDMMKRIAGQITPDRRVDYRHITGFQAIVVGIPADLFDYRLMVQVQPPDQAGFVLTNITNGIGLFTSQTITAFDLDPDPKSRDSIMYGQFTRHLNLKYY